jgi:hypothetical protein
MFICIQSDKVLTTNQNDVQLELDNCVKMLGNVGTPIIYPLDISFFNDWEEKDSRMNL